MKLKQLFFAVIFVIISQYLSGNSNDTIRVFIDLDRLDSNGLEIEVFFPSENKAESLYCFPVSIPGIYEYLNTNNRVSNFYTISGDGKKHIIKPPEESTCYELNNPEFAEKLIYRISNSENRRLGIGGEDAYFLKDSVFILNWHYILGFYNQNYDCIYKISIKKNPKLYGTGTLHRYSVNDSLDVFIADNYKSLIHNPIAYSIPDTCSFKIGETEFTISAIGNNDSLPAEKLKALLLPSLNVALKNSVYKPGHYTFIFFSEYSLTIPYLAALEHPSSTIVCYHSALMDNEIILSSSIHEFLHALYTPLRVRSKVIDGFNFLQPVCDEYLWLYEGVTEYLAVKTLMYSGAYTHERFLNELEYSTDYQNINFNKTSKNIYSKKGQKLFDNFYTKGCLFAMQLDVELLKLSDGKTDLLSVIKVLQEKYNPEKPFNSSDFISEFAQISQFDIQSFIEKYVNHKTRIDLHEIASDVGYSSVKQEKEPSYSFAIKKVYLNKYFSKNHMEFTIVGSSINTDHKSRKLTIKKIDDEWLTWYNATKIFEPQSDSELILLVNKGNRDELIKVKPTKILRPAEFPGWIKNDNFDLSYAIKFWSL